MPLPLAVRRAIYVGMKFPAIIAAPITALILTPPALQARDYGSVAGWQMAASGGTCGLYSARAGNGEIILLKNLAGDVHIQVTNEFWRNDDGSDIRFAIDGKRWNGRFGVTPAKSAKGQGYIGAFDKRIVALLRAGRQLTVQRDNVTLGAFSLSGSAAALNRMEFCLNDLRREGPAQVMTADAVAARSITPPKPANERGDWFKLSDYPSDLQRAGKDGTVLFQLSVNTRGRVSNCVVTQSSGHAELDAATCKAVTKRARFKPAVDGDGKKHEGKYDSRVTWRIPK